MVLGAFLGTQPYRGYIQFNNLPYMLTHAPISVTSALLDVTPASVRMPTYSFECSDEECTEWDHEMFAQSALGSLYDITCGSVPCGGFSLAGNDAPNLTWANSPVGTLIDTKPMVAAAPKGDAGSETSTWNVTNRIGPGTSRIHVRRTVPRSGSASTMSAPPISLSARCISRCRTATGSTSTRTVCICASVMTRRR